MNYCYWNTTMLTRCVATALWRSCTSFVTYFWRVWSAFNMFEDVFLLLLVDHILITLLPDLCQRTFSWDRWSSRFFLNSASMSHRSERSFSTFSKGALRLHAAHVHSKPYLRGSIKNSRFPFLGGEQVSVELDWYLFLKRSLLVWVSGWAWQDTP